MVCVDSLIVAHVGIGYFIFLIFTCWLFGRSKHNILVHENKFAITLLLNLLCVWYFSASYGGFCWIAWERDDGIFTIPFYQFAIGATLSIIFTQIISLRPKSGSLTVLVHFLWCLVYNFMFLWGTLAFKRTERVFWIASSIVLAVFSYYHAVKDSKASTANKPRMVTYLLVILGFYQFFNFSIHLWSPYQEHIINYFTSELLFLINSILSSTLVCLLVLQYNKGLLHNPQSKLIYPGFTNDTPNIAQLRRNFHLSAE